MFTPRQIVMAARLIFVAASLGMAILMLGPFQGLEQVFEGHPIDWGSGKDFYTVTGDITSWIGALRRSGPRAASTSRDSAISRRTSSAYAS